VETKLESEAAEKVRSWDDLNESRGSYKSTFWVSSAIRDVQGLMHLISQVENQVTYFRDFWLFLRQLDTLSASFLLSALPSKLHSRALRAYGLLFIVHNLQITSTEGNDGHISLSFLLNCPFLADVLRSPLRRLTFSIFLHR
jgi:hypothetical protein